MTAMKKRNAGRDPHTHDAWDAPTAGQIRILRKLGDRGPEPTTMPEATRRIDAAR